MLKTVSTKLLALSLTLFAHSVQAQNTPSSAHPAQTHVYPRVAGYVGLVHPLVAFDSDGTPC